MGIKEQTQACGWVLAQLGTGPYAHGAVQKVPRACACPRQGGTGGRAQGGNSGVHLVILTHVCPVSPQCPRKCVRLPETHCSWARVHAGACRRAQGAHVCMRWMHSAGTAVGEGLMMPVRTAALGGLGRSGQRHPSASCKREKAGPAPVRLTGPCASRDQGTDTQDRRRLAAGRALARTPHPPDRPRRSITPAEISGLPPDAPLGAGAPSQLCELWACPLCPWLL